MTGATLLGVRRLAPHLLIVNGHAGNIPAPPITSELARGLGASTTCTTDVPAAPGTDRRTLRHEDTVVHAREGETSMIMAVAPDLVHHDRLPGALGAARGLITGLSGLIHTSRSFAACTRSGGTCDRRAADAAKGRGLLTTYGHGIAQAPLDDQPFEATAGPVQQHAAQLPAVSAAHLTNW